MREESYPAGAYLTVRALRDEWAAVIAIRGNVISMATFKTRSEAFSAAIRKAEKEKLECLVQGAVA